MTEFRIDRRSFMTGLAVLATVGPALASAEAPLTFGPFGMPEDMQLIIPEDQLVVAIYNLAGKLLHKTADLKASLATAKGDVGVYIETPLITVNETCVINIERDGQKLFYMDSPVLGPLDTLTITGLKVTLT